MFLTRITRRMRRDEQGVALVAVIGLVVVSLLIVTLVTSSVVTALGRSSSTRASVQSQAAANAGIAAGRAMVDSNACTTASEYSSAAGATPAYTVKISWRAGSATNWTPGCPTISRAQVRYVATGTALSKGVAGQAAGDTSRVEATYGARTVTTSVVGTGAAIYSYGTLGGTGYTGVLGSVSGTGASVQVYNGDASCNGTITVGALPLTKVNANILVRNGNFTMTACTVDGDVSASGSVTLNGSDSLHTTKVTGAVSAASLAATGYSTVSGAVNVQAAPVVSSVPAISLLGILGLGTKSPSLPTATIKTSPAPVVPNWTEFDYQGIGDWPGFVLKTLTAADCNSLLTLDLSGLVTSQSMLVDARACTGGLSALNISLSRSVALIVPNTVDFHLGTIGLSLPTGASTKLWIVQPDSDPTDGKPTCPAGGKLTADGLVNLGLVPTMIYTPCTYTESNLVGGTTGQIYAGNAAFSSSILQTRKYVPIGLPGVDLTTSSSTATGPRTLISSRNVTGG